MAEFSIKHEVQELAGHVWHDLETGARVTGDEYWALKNAVKADPEAPDGGHSNEITIDHSTHPIENNDAERRTDIDLDTQAWPQAIPTALFSGARVPSQTTTPEVHPTKPNAQIVPNDNRPEGEPDPVALSADGPVDAVVEPIVPEPTPDEQQVAAEQELKPALGTVDEVGANDVPPEDPAQINPVEGSTAAQTVHAE